MKYSITEIADILHIKEDRLNDQEAVVSQLLTDSRSLNYPKETLFFALKTKNNDGHNYIAQLYKQGVRNFVVDHVDEVTRGMRDANFLVVDNPLEALQQVAMSHRRKFNIPVIGITGSRGKTTVKEWLNQLLKDDYKIVRSPRSYNSQIGVPLSLWDIDDNTQLAIIEAGISTTGRDGQPAGHDKAHDRHHHQHRQRAQRRLCLDAGEGEREVQDTHQLRVHRVLCRRPLVTSTIKPLLDVDVAQESPGRAPMPRASSMSRAWPRPTSSRRSPMCTAASSASSRPPSPATATWKTW